MSAESDIAKRRLEVIGAFLKLGVMGYGGPAVWGVLQAEVQERRGWLTKEQFVEGMAIVNALPGATLINMCIYSGYQRAGGWGGFLAGICFTAPAFGIMIALTMLHAEYAALPLLRYAFYGLAPVVLGIFAAAMHRLGRNAIKDNTALVFALIAGAAASWSPIGVAGILLLAGCMGIGRFHSASRGVIATLVLAGLIYASHFYDPQPLGMSLTYHTQPYKPALLEIGTYFLKVGAVTFGGGMSILVLLQDQLVNHLQWISNRQYLEGLTLGQFTPGPILMIAAYVGYKLAGVVGAAVAALAIFLPSFVMMLSILPFLERIRKVEWVKAAMRGIGPAVVGVLAVAIFQLLPHAAPDLFTKALLALSILLLIVWRPSTMLLLVCGAAIGVVVQVYGIQSLLHGMISIRGS